VSNVAVEVRGFDLPGRSCDPPPGGDRYENIHVGVARRAETVDFVPGDAPSACWAFEIDVRPDDAGAFDVRGPFVLGRRGERHLGLRWGTVGPDGSFSVFRGAKFRLFEPEVAFVREVIASGRLIIEVDLTDEEGYPRCATVRPPHVLWSAGS
jgi:Family of unknown function (DUF5990)